MQGTVEISGGSHTIKLIKKMLSQAALTEVSVMITGESGTGKEIAARFLHCHSKRADKPFIPVNCGAIPTDLLESELFGHEKGAFTGAISTRIGRFELANGGTIFLDEIGDMPLAMQVKLLRVIQEKVMERVGSNKSIKTDVRIIAATHRNLEAEIKKGTFREDLYYRLNVFPIEMPRLRDRLEDIPSIVADLTQKLHAEIGSTVDFTPDALQSLAQCEWQGNIRELANLIERLIVLYPNQTVDYHELPAKYQSGRDNKPAIPSTKFSEMSEVVLANPKADHAINLKEMLYHIELTYIKEALEKANGVVSHAAENLGMRRTTLVEKMKKFQLSK
ncbi:MAG: sigma-54 interaction domain-containing protein [Candidatus Berkiella sp.]